MTKIKFGIVIPGFTPDRGDGRRFVEQILRYIRVAEGYFDSAWISDHFVPWVNFAPRNAMTLESFSTVSYLSGIFHELTFGTAVLCVSYRNPTLVAKMGATLQLLTGGRLILGLGAGWNEYEYVAYGYDFPPAKMRVQQLEEAVCIIKKMWNEGRASFRGRHYSVDALCYPKPHPVPPIMIGGGGERHTLKTVARNADMWNIPLVSEKAFLHKLGVLKEHCRKENRDPDEIIRTIISHVLVAPTTEEARKIAPTNPFLHIGGNESHIIGNADQVMSKIELYAELGVQYFILRFVDFPKVGGIELFIKEVIPEFRT